MALILEHPPLRRSRPSLMQRLAHAPARMRGWIRLLGIVLAMVVVFAAAGDFSSLKSPLP